MQVRTLAVAAASWLLSTAGHVKAAEPGAEQLIERRASGASTALAGGILLGAVGAGISAYSLKPCKEPCDANSLGLVIGLPMVIGGAMFTLQGLRDGAAAEEMRRFEYRGTRSLRSVERSYLRRFDATVMTGAGIVSLAFGAGFAARGAICDAREDCERSTTTDYAIASGASVGGATMLVVGLFELAAANRLQRQLDESAFRFDAVVSNEHQMLLIEAGF